MVSVENLLFSSGKNLLNTMGYIAIALAWFYDFETGLNSANILQSPSRTQRWRQPL